MLSNVLGVLIAFVMVILLLSMVVTGLVQATSAVLRLRSRNLQQGVAALLSRYLPDGRPKSDYRALAARVLNDPNLATLEQVTKVGNIRRLLGPKVSWAPPAELARAIAATAGPLRSNSPRPTLESDASEEAIERTVVRMEPALKKRFQLFIRLWTILWSLIVAAMFQVNSAELLSLSAGQSTAADTHAAASDKVLALAKKSLPAGDANPAATTSDRENAQAQLEEFGIRFWGRGSAYYFDSLGLHWQAIIGVLMTGILMSFGAPFWFQKLQFLASLRDQKAPPVKPDK